jgi:hypothetical protein
MIDMQTVRVSGLNNRVPAPVLVVKLAGAALALGLLCVYLSILGRGLLPVTSTPLTNLRSGMDLPPAAGATNP